MPYSYCRTTLYLVLVPAWGTCLLYEYCCTRYIPACCTCLQDYIAALPPRSGKQERTTEGTKSSGGGYCCRLSLLPKCSTPPSRQSSCCAGGSVEETGTFPAPPPEQQPSLASSTARLPGTYHAWSTWYLMHRPYYHCCSSSTVVRMVHARALVACTVRSATTAHMYDTRKGSRRFVLHARKTHARTRGAVYRHTRTRSWKCLEGVRPMRHD